MKLFPKPVSKVILLMALACGCSFSAVAAEVDKGIVDPKKQSARIILFLNRTKRLKNFLLELSLLIHIPNRPTIF